ncbi:MAG: hypothetical protein O7D91_09470 [Planctomycetota bacterium]|nr:hypothetical protein [Planctomycetota bacterium]
MATLYANSDSVKLVLRNVGVEIGPLVQPGGELVAIYGATLGVPEAFRDHQGASTCC